MEDISHSRGPEQNFMDLKVVRRLRNPLPNTTYSLGWGNTSEHLGIIFQCHLDLHLIEVLVIVAPFFTL